jgi:hypothetical protein
MSKSMFEEYMTTAIRYRGGYQLSGSTFGRFIENKQYPPDSRGPEFGKLVMEVFAMINTNVRQNRQDRDDPDTFNPLSAVLKPRDFENIAADERHVFRGRTPLARTEAFQYYPDSQLSLVCQGANPNSIQGAKIHHIAPETALLGLCNTSQPSVAQSQLRIANEHFASGAPAPARHITPPGVNIVQNLFGGGAAGRASTGTPSMKSHPDPARVLPADFDMRVQLEMGPLRGNRIDWVWNTGFIPDPQFLDMMRQACTVLKLVVTGHWTFIWSKS